MKSLNVLEANTDFLVVDKPPGIVVQGAEHSMLTHLKSSLGLSELYPVHRLDYGTSGVVVLARTTAANQRLSAAFRDRKVIKYYLALSDRKPKKKQGSVVGDLIKARNGSYKLSRTKTNPARTRFVSFSVEEHLRLYLLRLYTGKTHQARVTLKAMGAPILGDERYGGSPADRMYLHAWKLILPWHGDQLEFTSNPSEGVWFKNFDIANIEDSESKFSEFFDH